MLCDAGPVCHCCVSLGWTCQTGCLAKQKGWFADVGLTTLTTLTTLTGLTQSEVSDWPDCLGNLTGLEWPEVSDWSNCLGGLTTLTTLTGLEYLNGLTVWWV